ncbi:MULTISPECIES: hypothetical protein [unclassified Streptomyces]|uniref:hypothetical protein n=1 Tax=unclassified Streptomyces TaxID=2593676 RepID=UPI00136E9D03|nr:MULTISPECIES: hypothetical protein [unclassified Streptomyces]NEA05227.1 hypothetical protein [Streptomyces sp. SID10116]MYY82483.1 hypothetical protein [Streptomyces sp. SID335]MYZ14031.1 hypothetical protein [Streptomyces sp. SID337]NDZ87976.1 hypothetical protein [Streptomyces sp. SID10115]NEB45400.1 hypothetical protein [Streptomyces sp. SID339]
MLMWPFSVELRPMAEGPGQVSASSSVPVYERAHSKHSGPRLVTHYLDRLGIGQRWTQLGEQHGIKVVDRMIPPGHGWCRAMHVPEALWPDGADLCVRVEWFPDPEIEKGRLDLFEAHWRDRVAAVVMGLESVGFVVQLPGPKQSPTDRRGADLLVYRLVEGAAPVSLPADGWAHLERYRRRPPGWREGTPEGAVRDRLREAGMLSRVGGAAAYFARELDRFLWPPYSSEAAYVGWCPVEGASLKGYRLAMSRLDAFLHAAGYEVKVHPRPWALGDVPYVIAYRIAGEPRA